MQDFRKKIIEHKGFALILSCNLSEIFLILRRIQRNVIIHLHTFSCKVRITLVGFQSNIYFLDRFRKILRSYENDSSGRRFVPCGQMDGRTDKMKLIVTFRNFSIALTTGYHTREAIWTKMYC